MQIPPPKHLPSLDAFSGEVIFLRDLAQLLGTSARTLSAVRRATPDELPVEFVGIDCHVRYTKAAVATWLEERSKRSSREHLRRIARTSKGRDR